MIVRPSSTQALDQTPHLVLDVGVEHDERILDAPVGRVGDVRDAREAVEGDVVLRRVARQHAQRALAQLARLGEPGGEALDRFARGLRAAARPSVAIGVRAGGDRLLPPLLDLREPMAHRVDEQRLPLRIVEQVILQVGIALDDPDVAEHLEQHARRAARASLPAEFVEQLPHRRAEQPDDDLAIRERRVVVRDLAQARRCRRARRR